MSADNENIEVPQKQILHIGEGKSKKKKGSILKKKKKTPTKKKVRIKRTPKIKKVKEPKPKRGRPKKIRQKKDVGVKSAFLGQLQDMLKGAPISTKERKRDLFQQQMAETSFKGLTDPTAISPFRTPQTSISTDVARLPITAQQRLQELLEREVHRHAPALSTEEVKRAMKPPKPPTKRARIRKPKPIDIDAMELELMKQDLRNLPFVQEPPDDIFKRIKAPKKKMKLKVKPLPQMGSKVQPEQILAMFQDIHANPDITRQDQGLAMNALLGYWEKGIPAIDTLRSLVTNRVQIMRTMQLLKDTYEKVRMLPQIEMAPRVEEVFDEPDVPKPSPKGRKKLTEVEKLNNTIIKQTQILTEAKTATKKRNATQRIASAAERLQELGAPIPVLPVGFEFESPLAPAVEPAELGEHDFPALVDPEVDDTIGLASMGLGFTWQLSRNAPNIINQYVHTHKDWQITQIRVCRTPLPEYLAKVLNLIKLGKLRGELDKRNIDKFFHLFLLISLVSPDGEEDERIILEKNERLSLMKAEREPNDLIESVDVPINKELTLGEFFVNGEEMGGADHYIYDVVNSNCQVFVRDLLQGSNLLTPELNAFIMQDLDNLLPKWTQMLVKGTTNVANIFKRLLGMGSNGIYRGGDGDDWDIIEDISKIKVGMAEERRKEEARRLKEKSNIENLADWFSVIMDRRGAPNVLGQGMEPSTADQLQAMIAPEQEQAQTKPSTQTPPTTPTPPKPPTPPMPMPKSSHAWSGTDQLKELQALIKMAKSKLDSPDAFQESRAQSYQLGKKEALEERPSYTEKQWEEMREKTALSRAKDNKPEPKVETKDASVGNGYRLVRWGYGGADYSFY
jgi:hypothetical protein